MYIYYVHVWFPTFFRFFVQVILHILTISGYLSTSTPSSTDSFQAETHEKNLVTGKFHIQIRAFSMATLADQRYSFSDLLVPQPWAT